MKILCTLLFILCFTPSVLQSQYGWVDIPTGITGINSFDFADANTGFIVCNGHVYKSTSGGINWIEMVPGMFTGSLYDVKCINQQEVLMIAGNSIYRTSNGGTLWQNMYSAGLSNSSFQFVNSSVGFAFPSNLNYSSYIYYSNSSGVYWNSYYGNPQYAVTNANCSFINLYTGWITGYYHFYYPPYADYERYYLQKTTNIGGNYTYVNYVDARHNDFNSIIWFLDSVKGFWYNPSSHLVRTVNGGINWTYTGVDTNITFNRIYFYDNFSGWAIGNNGAIYSTINSGDNWHSQQSNVSANLTKVVFVNSNTGWILCSDNTLLKTTNGGNPIGIEKISTEIPNSFLLFQNYPNPFNPETKIFFEVPQKSKENIRISIYDIQGKVISELVNEKLSAGKYSVGWNASGISSGIYFYRLESDGFMDTKKMILLK